MKKAIVYFIFLGLLLSNSPVHAIAFSKDAKVKVAAYKVHNQKTVLHGVSKKGSFSHKAELLNDFDDDFDEYDDHEASVKDKASVIDLTSFNSNQLTAEYSSKTFCTKIYNHVNFSRLPRYNYISLRVLRL